MVNTWEVYLVNALSVRKPLCFVRALTTNQSLRCSQNFYRKKAFGGRNFDGVAG